MHFHVWTEKHDQAFNIIAAISFNLLISYKVHLIIKCFQLKWKKKHNPEVILFYVRKTQKSLSEMLNWFLLTMLDYVLSSIVSTLWISYAWLVLSHQNVETVSAAGDWRRERNVEKEEKKNGTIRKHWFNRAQCQRTQVYGNRQPFLINGGLPRLQWKALSTQSSLRGGVEPHSLELILSLVFRKQH